MSIISQNVIIILNSALHLLIGLFTIRNSNIGYMVRSRPKSVGKTWVKLLVLFIFPPKTSEEDLDPRYKLR